MRSLSALATLLLGLAFVFWAPAAKADCPHGTKNIHPHCDGVEPPPPEVTLDVLGCSVEGQVAKIVSGEWACAVDVDTTIPDTDTLGDLSLLCPS